MVKMSKHKNWSEYKYVLINFTVSEFGVLWKTVICNALYNTNVFYCMNALELVRFSA
jgi:hypothetical protein